jgi:hypothetical protein
MKRLPSKRDEYTEYDELSELAVMSALAMWLSRWQPIAVHSAVLAGARPEAVAGALGDTVEVAFARWREWALRQSRPLRGLSRALVMLLSTPKRLLLK